MKNPFAALIGVFLTLSIAMAGCSSSSGSAESSSSEENNRVSSSQTASRSSEEEDNIPVSNTTELTVRFGDDGEPFVMHLEKNSTAEAIAGYVGTSDWRLPVYSYDESDVMEYYDIPSRYEIPDNSETATKAHAGDVKIAGCDIVSPEFGWSVRGIEMEDCDAESEYFMMRSANLHFTNVRMKGKYSFQYIENSVFENCIFDTKDAFWHARNITVRNSVVKGEYLAWYCENVTFENCKIIGTQPLCYCRGLKLVGCEMIDCDLAFERSEVEATVTAPVISIKNPLSGYIAVPAVGEIIRDIEEAKGTVQVQKQEAKSVCACA